MMLFTKYLIKENENALAESAENFSIGLKSFIDLGIKR